MAVNATRSETVQVTCSAKGDGRRHAIVIICVRINTKWLTSRTSGLSLLPGERTVKNLG